MIVDDSVKVALYTMSQRSQYHICIIIFPSALNVYHIALGRRSIIKTYSVRLHMEDSFRTQILLPWQLLVDMLGLFFEATWLLDGVSRFLHGEFSVFLGKQNKHPRSFNWQSYKKMACTKTRNTETNHRNETTESTRTAETTETPKRNQRNHRKNYKNLNRSRLLFHGVLVAILVVLA